MLGNWVATFSIRGVSIRRNDSRETACSVPDEGGVSMVRNIHRWMKPHKLSYYVYEGIFLNRSWRPP
jgi:hypothetical protein